MTVPDFITLLLYLVGIFAISTLSARRISNQKDMFSAGRSSPWWASGLSGFMTMFSAGTFVVWGGIAYRLGIVAVMINTCYGIAALLVGRFVAGRWNQLGVSTPAEYVRWRFGKTGLHFFTWTMMLKRILGVSVSLYALGVLSVALMPQGAPSQTWAIIIFGVIVVVYTMQGGLWAVLMTDVLQFIVLTVVVFMVAVLMISAMNSPADYVSSVPEHFFSPVAGDYGWLFLTGWTTIHFFIVGAEWAFVQRFIAVRSPDDAKKSCYLFGIMYLVTPLFWLLPPLLYRSQTSDANPEQAYILAAQSVLPPGVLGLMVAAMFSATASMVSSQLNVFAGVLTNDFYRAFFNPNASEQTLVATGRMFTAILGALLVTVAVLVPHLGGAEKLIITVNSLLVVPLLAPALWGLFSRKIGIREMCLVALTSFFISVFLRFGIATNPLILETDWLAPLATYLSKNIKNLEVVVGVILPILMLLALERLKRGKDPGWKVLEDERALLQSSIQESNITASFDSFPARMVMISLLVMAIGMVALGFFVSQGRTVLLSFGVILLLIAGIIHLVISRLDSIHR